MFKLTSALLFLAGAYAREGVPTVVFHGMHDNCENNKVLVGILKEKTHAYVECIEIGDGVSTSMWKKFMDQAKEACNKVLEHPEF